MRKLAPLAVLLSLGASLVSGTAPVPRKSPNLTIIEDSGKQMQLSSLRGKVVVIEFLLTNCPHCMLVTQTISKLYAQMGSRGFQPIGIAFDNGIKGESVENLARKLGITFPMGYTSSAEVDSYLGRTGMERLQVPQLVVIDRKGVIRAQSRPAREVNLENEFYLRALINGLLKESGPTVSTRKTASHRGAPH